VRAEVFVVASGTSPGPTTNHVYLQAFNLSGALLAEDDFRCNIFVDPFICNPEGLSISRSSNDISFVEFSAGIGPGVNRVGASDIFTFSSIVPEPSTWLLLGTGLVVLAFARRKRAA